jgi:predicted secreted hydrolase
MIYAVRAPDGSVPGARVSMAEAQQWIAEMEPDVLRQADWQIHPIDSPADAEAAKVRLQWHIRLDKFEGDALVETIERQGVE